MTDQKNQQKGSVLFLLKGVSIGSLFWLTAAPGFLFLLVSSAELISRDKGYKESTSTVALAVLVASCNVAS